ncbi:TetR/AcrR family transcriptional regulator [Paraconexibacter algicola]|uniref:TetR/AcrR family transcriptional regulator n=1 Tax=Paraconexibacter algicola TaxID=2133960 RepID=UPI001304D7ED|nr:TetR/AcrR family transcriptional regulator [Paraconexibacter algicola]
MAVEERQRQRRRRLIEAGFTLLSEKGPEALTVTGVCAAAKLTSRYFYEHFDNRDALLTAIVREQAEAVSTQIITAATEQDGTAEERARAAVHALLGAIDADPRRLQMARDHDEVVLRMRAVVAERMTELLAENPEALWPGKAGHARVPLAATLTTGGILHLIADWADGRSKLERDDVVRLGARFAVFTGESVLS